MTVINDLKEVNGESSLCCDVEQLSHVHVGAGRTRTRSKVEACEHGVAELQVTNIAVFFSVQGSKLVPNNIIIL